MEVHLSPLILLLLLHCAHSRVIHPLDGAMGVVLGKSFSVQFT